MSHGQILYEVADRIATITLNRPQRLNAWTHTMEHEVRQAMAEAAADDAVRVIVLTGAGRGFCAGADVDLLSGSSRETKPPPPPPGTGEFRGRYAYFPNLPKPVIAAVNGPAAGLGMILALFCDIRFAGTEALFSTAFARRGLIAEHGIAWLLPRLVGAAHSFDLLLSARRIGAAEALAMGLVNRVLPQERLMDEVRSYAAELAYSVSPRSLAEIKREIWQALWQSPGEATDAAEIDMKASFQAEDFREGMAHFMEKRPPRFTGR